MRGNERGDEKGEGERREGVRGARMGEGLK